MTSLWLSLALLAVVAMLFVLVPVWRYRGGAQSTLEQRRDKNREVFRQREAELAKELEQGIVTPEDYAKMHTELQRAFLADMQELERQDTGTTRRAGGKGLLVGLAILVPVVSFVFYRGWGSGPDLVLPEILDRVVGAQTDEARLAELNALADFLQERLERHPDDVQNGYMLGTLYLEIDRYADAVATLRGLLEQVEEEGDRATVLGQLAQAQYMLDDTMITPAVQAIIDEALAINPNEYAVMSILAIDAFQRQDLATAAAYWRRQLSSARPGSQDAQVLRDRIAAVEAYLPKEEPAEGTAAAAGGDQITVVIDVAEELKAQLTGKVSLFVFARRPEMPMPIVAENLPIPEFPFTVVLDNSDSMTGATLESAPSLVVGARLSGSGNAIAQSGDFETLSEPFVLAEQTEPLQLTIDEVVP